MGVEDGFTKQWQRWVLFSGAVHRQLLMILIAFGNKHLRTGDSCSNWLPGKIRSDQILATVKETGGSKRRFHGKQWQRCRLLLAAAHRQF